MNEDDSKPTKATRDDAQHQREMAALQVKMKAKMKIARDKRGLVIVNTGNGKGKSTASFGVITRTLAYGGKVVVVQFIKATPDAAEKVLRCDQLTWHACGGGFTWDTQDRAADIALCEKGWAIAEAAMQDESVSLVVLDELNVVLHLDYLPLARVLSALVSRPAMQHVVITGRDAPDALVESADLVTEMQEVKHPFAVGVQAQRGIEF